MKHTCHWPGCTVVVPPRLWGCREHWYRLPRDIRSRITANYVPGQEVSKTPTYWYLAAVKEAREYAEVSNAMEMPNMFRWCGYWGHWSRILNRCIDDQVIELDLTAINPHWPEAWNKVRTINFRSHGSSFDRRHDKLVSTLSDDWRALMVEHLGEDLTRRLIETDWLPLLNLKRVHEGRYGGGGLPFAECAKAAA